MMDHKEWLDKLVSADKNHEWEELKTLAERRLAVAPGDLNAIGGLKKANLKLNPELVTETALFDETEYIVIKPVAEPESQKIRRPQSPQQGILSALLICSAIIAVSLILMIVFATVTTNSNNSEVMTQRAIYETEGNSGRASNQDNWLQIRSTEVAVAEETLRPLIAGQTTVGLMGWADTGCKVADIQHRVTRAELSDDPWVYLAVPFTEALVGRKFSHRWENPDGTLISGSTLRIVGGGSTHTNCLRRMVQFDAVEDTGFKKLEIRVDDELFYEGGILIVE